MKFTPLGDRLLIKKDKPKDKTPGGIHLPDTGVWRPNQGKIVAVGDGVKSTFLKPDDTVLFQEYAGLSTEPSKDGDLVIMREEDILAIIEE